jgi:hypothetical protein
VLIYDLNDLTDNSALPAPGVRTIHHVVVPNGDTVPEVSEWHVATDPMTVAECQSVPHPQFSPACYKVAEVVKFNPSGTRLYFGDVGLWDELRDPGTGWGSVARIHIARVDGMGQDRPLADWVLTGPELVYAVDQLAAGEVSGALPRPDSDPLQLPSPEHIAVGENEDSDYPRSGTIWILDADQCAAAYAPHARGTLDAPSDFWLGCKDQSTFNSRTTLSGGYSWQSSDAMLMHSYVDRDGSIWDIHRIHFSGPLAGTEQLIIEHASEADTGL